MAMLRMSLTMICVLPYREMKLQSDVVLLERKVVNVQEKLKESVCLSEALQDKVLKLQQREDDLQAKCAEALGKMQTRTTHVQA